MAPKKKQEKMSLGTFLGDQSFGSWAEEMDDMPMPSTTSQSRPGYNSDRPSFGPRQPYGEDRSFSNERHFAPREPLPLPTKPPFTAHLGNLSFDATAGDIEDFFAGCSVTNVRIVEDKLDHKPKGFGYVEFGTLEGLKKALEANGTNFQGRNVRVSVADPPKERQEARELSDWTRKGPLPDLPNNQRKVSERNFRSFDNTSDAGSDKGGSRRGPYEAGDGKTRDFSTWERKGPLSPLPAPAAQDTVRRNERSFERKVSPNWGDARSQDGSRPPRREFQERGEKSERPERPERTPTAAEMDTQWRARMKPDAPPQSPTAPAAELSTPSSPSAAPAPAVRPKLNLQKRTVSEVPTADPVAAAAAAGNADSKASPFGAARPIDSAAREREVAEKRLALRLKKEQEDKENAEKRAAEKAERAAKSPREKNASTPTSPTTQPNGKTLLSKEPAKENGAAPFQPGKKFELLRRVADHEEAENGEAAEHYEADEDGEENSHDQPANGEIVEDKSVKPQEVINDPQSPTEPETTAQSLDSEGWSTVQKPTKKTRGGNKPRGIAS